MKKFILLFCTALCISASLSAQLSLLANSLAAPIGIKADQWGNVWVANTGTGNNDGSVTVIARDGKKFTAFENLPSKVNPAVGDIVGPWRVIPMSYGRMAIILGGSSALGAHFGKLLFFDLSDYTPGDPAMTLADTTHSYNVGAFGLATSTNNDSDIFSGAQDPDGNWYITDAGSNNLLKVSRNGKEMSIFAKFSGIPNPTPVGPPVIDAVPTGIVALPQYQGFLVTTLTGFPFINGKASIYKVDLNGNVSTYATGLTMLTDIDRDDFGNVYVNQFGTFSLGGGFKFGSGQVIRLRQGHVIDTIAKGYGPGSGLSIYQNRKFYVTSLFTNQALSGVIPTESAEPRESIAMDYNISLAPNPATERVTIQWKNTQPSSKVKIQLTDLAGKVLYQKANIDAIWNTHQIDVSRFQAGSYVLTMNINGALTSKNITVIR